MACTSAYASRCGRWLTAANTRSCSSGDMVWTLAPHACHAAPTRATASGALSASGASTTFRPRNRSAFAAATPLSSAPAIGCAGTNCASLTPSAARAAATTSRLVLPASVTSAAPDSAPERAAKTAGNGAARRLRDRSCDRIDDAPIERELQVAGIAAEAHDVLAAPRLLERQRERAADQTDADDGDALERRHSLRLAARAARKVSFSSGVPAVTRRCSGSS